MKYSLIGNIQFRAWMSFFMFWLPTLIYNQIDFNSFSLVAIPVITIGVAMFVMFVMIFNDFFSLGDDREVDGLNETPFFDLVADYVYHTVIFSLSAIAGVTYAEQIIIHINSQINPAVAGIAQAITVYYAIYLGLWSMEMLIQAAHSAEVGGTIKYIDEYRIPQDKTKEDKARNILRSYKRFNSFYDLSNKRKREELTSRLEAKDNEQTEVDPQTLGSKQLKVSK